MIEGVLFDGAEDNLLSASGLPVGNGDDSNHLVTGRLYNGIETFDGEVGGSEIDDSHCLIACVFLGDGFLEGEHLEGRDGAFDTFVTMLATGAVEGLLHSVGGEDAEDDGAFMFDGHIRDALRDGLADKLKVTGLALDDAADADDGIGILGIEHDVGSRREFKGAGDTPHYEVFLFDAVFEECVDGPLEEDVGDFGIPFCRNDANAVCAAIGD